MVFPDQAKRARRTHRKSRLGCQPCKQRKIKCDESNPVCTNCVRREIECKFLSRRPREDLGSGSGEGEEWLAVASGSANHVLDPETAPVQSRGRDRRNLRFVSSNYSLKAELACTNLESNQMPSDFSGVPSEQNMQTMSDRIETLEKTIQQLTPMQPLEALTYADMELLHHYFVLTGQSSWEMQTLEIGFRQPHILHLILGISALHCARQTPSRRAEFVAQADRHYVTGMRGATKLLSDISEDKCALVYRSAILISLYNLAVGPQPGEYIGFSDHDGRATFLVFLRGVRSIRENVKDAQRTPTPPAFDAAEIAPENISTTPNLRGAPEGVVGYKLHFQKLRKLALTSFDDPLSSRSRDAPLYLSALDNLEPFFTVAYADVDAAATVAADAHSHVPFAWLYRQSDEFINRLQGKAPLALAIFACFAVVLKKLETGWTVEGWPEQIMSGVWKFLRPESRDLVRCPIELLGWKPPEDGFMSQKSVMP